MAFKRVELLDQRPDALRAGLNITRFGEAERGEHF
jgi:hypothetical protein